MIRICFVGNSHLGAIKQALSGFLQKNNIEADVVFWGVAGTNFSYPQVHYDSGSLISPLPHFSEMVSGGRYREKLPLLDFDVVVFYAADVGISSTAQMLQWRLRDRRNYSGRFFDAAVDDLLKTRMSATAVSKIINDIPVDERPAKIVVCPSPLYAPSSKHFPNIEYGRQLVSRVFDATRSHFEKNGAVFVSQPEATMESGLYTKQSFSTQSVKLLEGVPHGDDDYSHMNADFGEIMLTAIFSRIDALHAGDYAAQPA
jgi:hypothetical protein